MDTRLIDRDSGVPPWRQMAAILRERIESGELTGRLPTEPMLAAEFGVGLSTARKATRSLREAGLIETYQGYGSVVTYRDQNG